MPNLINAKALFAQRQNEAARDLARREVVARAGALVLPVVLATVAPEPT